MKASGIKKRGGDTRLAAARNDKKVGPPPKTDAPFEKRVLVPLAEDDFDMLGAFARADGVSKQDLIRAAVRRYLIERQII